jgi:hypothetical protein
MSGTAVLGNQPPAPSNINMTDVKQVEAATRAMRALDYQFGGGACRDAVVAQLPWAQRLLSASSTDLVWVRLLRALGDLQNLAGWATFDLGLLDSARNHFASALKYAKQSGDSDLVSNIMYRSAGSTYTMTHPVPHSSGSSWVSPPRRIPARRWLLRCSVATKHGPTRWWVTTATRNR